MRPLISLSLVSLLLACDTQPLEKPETDPSLTLKQAFLQKLNNKVDILFVVDNSPSMETVQTHLAARFPDFIDALKNLPNGLPDLHIGIASTDLGTGQVTSGVPGCSKQPYGDTGVLQNTAGWTYTWDSVVGKLTTTRKSCTPPAQRWIAATGGIGTEGDTNYAGTMTDAFSCIASIGATGCGFEHVLGSMLRALDVDPWLPAPAENKGFLRPDAYLAIILITNEDDCSAPPDSILFDPGSKDLSGQFGPLSSYRCNAFGHRCDGKPVPMRPTDPQFAGGDRYAPSSCESLEDGTLLKISEVVARVKSLKPSTELVFTAALAGPPAPYAVGLDAAGPNQAGYGGQLWPKIQPSCTLAGVAGVAGPAGTADPAVRVKQFVDQMGGVFESICATDFGAALAKIGSALSRTLAPQCLAARLQDRDLATPGLQPECQVVDRQKNDAGEWVETTLPACSDPTGAAPSVQPCWFVTTSADCTAAGKPNDQVIQVSRVDPNALPAGADIQVGCVTCLDRTSPGCDY